MLRVCGDPAAVAISWPRRRHTSQGPVVG